MSFRLVNSGGATVDVAFVNLSASGTVKNGEPVDFLRNGTGGSVVGPSEVGSTQTMIFGVCLDYAQGASNTNVKVIPFAPHQLWEVDCANAASTAQLGFRHALGTRGFVHNLLSDSTGHTGVFLALAMVGAATGSGKLIGRFLNNSVPAPVNSTTFLA